MSLYNKASLVQIPSGYKAGTTDNLYSVLPANGNGDFNATRSSTATRVNKDGLIESVAINEPRLDYPLLDGVVQDCPVLLLEPSRTNFGRYSEQISSWTQLRTTTLNNQTISPDGSQGASKSTVTATFGSHAPYIDQSATVTSGANYVMSIFVKKYTTKYVKFTEGYSNYGVIFNFDTEEITGNGNASSSDIGVEKYPNGWYRLSVKFIGSATTNTQPALYLLRDVDGAESYTGSNEAVFLWGLQMEAGTYTTSYIPNLSTGTTTRSAETTNKTGVESLLGQSEGTLFLEFVPQNTSDLQIMFQIRTTGSTNVGQVDIRFQSGQIRAFGSDNSGATQFSIAGGSITAGTNYKAAIRYKTNDAKFYINGSSVGTDTSCSFTSSTKQQISFAENLTSFKPSIKVKQAMVFDEALTDSELQTLTS